MHVKGYISLILLEYSFFSSSFSKLWLLKDVLVYVYILFYDCVCITNKLIHWWQMVIFDCLCNDVSIKSFNANMTKLGKTLYQTYMMIYVKGNV